MYYITKNLIFLKHLELFSIQMCIFYISGILVHRRHCLFVLYCFHCSIGRIQWFGHVGLRISVLGWCPNCRRSKLMERRLFPSCCYYEANVGVSRRFSQICDQSQNTTSLWKWMIGCWHSMACLENLGAPRCKTILYNQY